jgi:sarcosine oxidase/L-pipecolate oxidase
MSSSQQTTSIIIVGGGGTIGSSTALHLVRSGYTPSNITVLDTYPIPSAQSAGNDLNKIMGIQSKNKVDLQLSLEALYMWKEDDLFKEYFHNTGRVRPSLNVKIVYTCGLTDALSSTARTHPRA